MTATMYTLFAPDGTPAIRGDLTASTFANVHAARDFAIAAACNGRMVVTLRRVEVEVVKPPVDGDDNTGR